MADARQAIAELEKALAEMRAQVAELEELGERATDLAVPAEIAAVLQQLDDLVEPPHSSAPLMACFGIQG